MQALTFPRCESPSTVVARGDISLQRNDLPLRGQSALSRLVCRRMLSLRHSFGEQRASINYWRGQFRPLHDHLLAMGTVATVYFWDDMHDRYLISDIVGVQMPNGFDTTTAPNSITTWSRLSRNARDDIQREFDPATGRHKLHYTFIVGK